jgi:alpha-galactosidase
MASPLLISANVIKMSAMNMATYKNKKVIAVNQDPLGKQGTRLVGGPLLEAPTPALGNTPAMLTACNAKDGGQKWVLNSPDKGYVQNPKTSLCLNIDNCGTF